MKKATFLVIAATTMVNAQNLMTPEKLWTLNKMSVVAVSPDKSSLVYDLATVDINTEKTNHEK